jgi:hypothetical protein
MLVLLTCCGGSGETSPTTTYTAGQQISTISSPSGEVLLKKQGIDIWVEAVHGAKVGAGDEIKTGSDGFLMILLFDGSVIEIEANTEIAISELTVADTGSTLIRLQQTIGNTLSRVNQLVDTASSYEIETPAGTATVRGTIFRVEVDDIGNTKVISIEGRVWFTAGGVTVVVDEGMQGGASPEGTPTIRQLVSTPAPTSTLTATPVPTQIPGMTISGEVLIKKQGTDVWVQAVQGAEVGAGDEIKTGSDGFLMILLFDGSVIEIGADTEIAIGVLAIAETGSTLVRLQQTIGTTLSRIQQLADATSSYEIETPAGTAAVRGTVFIVEVDNIGYTTVTSEEGRVWFNAGGVTVVVDEGMQSSASPEGTPTTPQIS